MRTAPIATSSTLAAIAVLHVGWACGASFPFHDRMRLADSVAGSSGATPRRAVVLGDAFVLAGRGAVGVAGRTSSLVPWTSSAHFNELDKRYYGPLCLLLASGALLSVR